MDAIFNFANSEDLKELLNNYDTVEFKRSAYGHHKTDLHLTKLFSTEAVQEIRKIKEIVYKEGDLNRDIYIVDMQILRIVITLKRYGTYETN